MGNWGWLRYLAAWAGLAVAEGATVPEGENEDKWIVDQPFVVSMVDSDSLLVTVENDVFGGKDRWYTSGLRVEGMVSSEYRVAVGQQIFTPENAAATALLPDDRPYAGWLFADFARVFAPVDRPDVSLLGVQVGVTGEGSLGEQVQSLYHDSRDSGDWRGWDNQLGTEVAFAAYGDYARRWRLLASRYGRLFGLGADLWGHGGVALGTLATEANAGAALRAGWGLPPGFSPPSRRFGGRFPWAGSGFSLAVWAGAQARFVARDLFLDGNTFDDSHSVDKYAGVFDAYAGLGLAWGRFSAEYSLIRRTREFRGQSEPSVHGALTGGWRF